MARAAASWLVSAWAGIESIDPSIRTPFESLQGMSDEHTRRPLGEILSTQAQGVEGSSGVRGAASGLRTRVRQTALPERVIVFLPHSRQPGDVVADSPRRPFDPRPRLAVFPPP